MLSLFYRLIRLPIPNDAKFRFFLNLEWIFERLSHEMSFRVYDAKRHPVRLLSKTFLLDGVQPEHVVLDLGCKLGDISDLLAGKAKRVVGVDRDEAAIRVAQAQYSRSNLTFIHGDAVTYLEKQADRFDVLILSHILEHLDQPKEFLLTFRKHFRFVYIEVPDFDRSFLTHYRKDLNMPLIYSDDDHVSEFDRHELGQILRESGLSVVNAEFIFGVQKYWCRVE